MRPSRTGWPSTQFVNKCHDAYENGGAGAGEHVVNNFNLVQGDLGSFSEELTLKLRP